MNKSTPIEHPTTQSRVYEHIYLKGNFGNIMFYDKVDKINVWNRLWLSAASTGVQILSVAILDNHLHINVLIDKKGEDSNFMHYFRLSITQYHNHRYDLHGMLGTRDFGRGVLKDIEDIKDCICYHARNVLHHQIDNDFMNYQFSTVRCIFGLQKYDPDSCYTTKTLPRKMAKAYLPACRKLPVGWLMTQQGMIIPPKSVFRGDLLEILFISSEKYLETLKHRTMREKEDRDTPAPPIFVHPTTESQTLSQSKKLSPTEKAMEFLKNRYSIEIPQMTPGQKMEAIQLLLEAFPKISFRLLARIFDIPVSTIKYRVDNWFTHD